jgi:hypothetical protein
MSDEIQLKEETMRAGRKPTQGKKMPERITVRLLREQRETLEYLAAHLNIDPSSLARKFIQDGLNSLDSELCPNQVLVVEIDDRGLPVEPGTKWYLSEKYGNLPETAQIPLSSDSSYYCLLYLAPTCHVSDEIQIDPRAKVYKRNLSELGTLVNHQELAHAPRWLVNLTCKNCKDNSIEIS